MGQDAQSGLFVGVNRTDRRGQSVAASGSRKSDGSSRVKEINLCLLLHKILRVSVFFLVEIIFEEVNQGGIFCMRQIVFECTTSIPDKQSHVNGKGRLGSQRRRVFVGRPHLNSLRLRQTDAA